MRARVIALALSLGACSYDWASVQPIGARDASTDSPATFDPRHTVLPPWSCNPVSMDGCASGNYCLGKIEQSQTFSSLTCHASFGSGTQGVFCDGASNCVPGFLCWTSPTDATTHTCERPCFSDEDCGGGHCDTTGAYASPYGRATLYRCN
jgi:hypothetical protein